MKSRVTLRCIVTIILGLRVTCWCCSLWTWFACIAITIALLAWYFFASLHASCQHSERTYLWIRGLISLRSTTVKRVDVMSGVQSTGLNFNTRGSQVQDSRSWRNFVLESWTVTLGSEYWSSILGIEVQYSGCIGTAPVALKTCASMCPSICCIA